jgi:signal transduction histidine kinase/DNA-binding response OmpR family regulator/HPt (histidine-containing phosphotransfer) domain-containing protein
MTSVLPDSSLNSTPTTESSRFDALPVWRLRTILICSLLVFALLPAGLVGGLMYKSTLQNVDKLSNKIIYDVAYRVQLDTENHLLQAHSLLNGIVLPQPTPEQSQDVVKLMGEPAAFEGMAFSLTRMLPDVSFLYFGNTQGAFYGVQQIAGAAMQRAKIHLKPAAANQRQYFSALHPLDRSQEMPPETAAFDPRKRPWYTLAETQKARAFTSVYASASTGQLLITLAQPVMDTTGLTQGVVGVDLFLKALTQRLQAQKISDNGIAMLIDEQGYLVATSTPEDLFKSNDGKLIRLKPSESNNATMRQAYAAFLEFQKNKSKATGNLEPELQQYLSTAEGEKLIAAMRPFGQAQGLKWTMIIAAPDSDFAGETRRSIQQSVYATLLVLALGAAAATLFAYSLSRRFARLTQAAADLGLGEVPQVQRRAKIAEVRTLSVAMHRSAVEIKSKRAEIEAQALALQDANEHLEERVEQRTQELEASREEALSAARAKASFLATMSHEIRTPLNGVVGMTTLLADTPMNAEQRDYVHTMQVSSDQLLGVINDILDFSKIESGKLDLENEPLNLLTTIEEACDIAATRAREKKLKLLIDVPDTVPSWVKGDVTRLRQVLLNFINNAIKFTERGEIVVCVKTLSTNASAGTSMLEFRVNDTGIGIPSTRISSLFQSFSQVDTSTARRYGGTGLGLAICKRLAQIMGGQVGVESVLGEGSSFWFTAQLNHTKAQEPADASSYYMASLRGKRVLLLDDTPLNLRIQDKQVKRWGMTTVLFERASPALDWLATHPVELIVADMHMPDMDGYEFAKTLRLTQPKAKIILLTSGTAPTGEVASMFDSVLLKPYRQSQLFDALIRASGAQASPDQVLLAAAKKHQHILVADDNVVNLKVAVAMLAKLGYDTTVAHDGQEAVDKVEQSMSGQGLVPQFYAILMDANMPVMDGYGAAQQILARFGADAPPMIALTASVMEEDRQRCLDAGMPGFLPKPLRLDELSAALSQYAVPVAARNGPALHGLPLASASHQPPAPAALSGVMNWDRLAQFKELDDADLSMTHEIIALFQADAPRRLEDLRTAVHSKDNAALSLAAHALKGSASNVGAVGLANACFALEQDCSNQAWPVLTGQHMQQIEQYAQATLIELGQFK